MLTSQLSTKHREEIEARGLDLALCQRYGVRSHNEAIAFDYMLNGAVHNSKHRRAKGDMPWAKTGVPLVLWNADALKGDPLERELIITEGEFDALACIQAGFLDAVSVPNGAPVSAEENGEARFKYLFKGDKLHPEIDKFSKFILAVDGDEKGLYLRDALAVRLGETRCLWIDWPAGCKDANDVLREHGADRLAEVLMNPKRMFTDEVATLDDIPDPPEERAYNIGLVGLENHLKLPKKGLVTILGPYGSGKSTLVRQIIYNMHSLHGWKTGITCFEESAKWRTVNAFRKIVIGKPKNYWTPDETTMADNWIRRNIVFFQKRKGELMTGARYLDRVQYAVKVYGLNMIVTDPVNEVDHTWPHGTSKTDYMGQFIMAMKDLSDSFNFLNVFCIHPPSMSMRTQNNKRKKIFTIADGADTAHYGNKSDIGLAVWQGNGSGFTLVNIDKIKNRELYGEPTGVELKFMKEQEKYVVSRTGWDVLFEEDSEASE
jgi:twinkle protein